MLGLRGLWWDASLGLGDVVVAGTGTQPDSVLAEAAAEGDEHAVDELYRRHHGAVLRYARGLVRDQHLAEDLTSEAFARTFAALRQGLGPREACRPYLYTVVRNAAVDWARAGRRTVVTDQVAEWAAEPEDDPPDVDELDALVRAFRSLPERWQTVLWYTLIEDESVQKVAEMLGLEAGAVSQLSYRAREGLREAFLAASCGGRPECAEFTSQLAAGVRRPGRRRSRALRRHLESCEGCRQASEEMTDLNGRLRRVLPIGIAVLGAPTAALGPLVPAASLPGWAVPTVAGAVAGIAALLFTMLGGMPGGSDEPPRAVPSVPSPAPSTPRTVAEPARPDHTVASRRAPRGAPQERRRPRVGGLQVRSTTLQSCLAVDGTTVVQRSCTSPASAWKRSNTGGGFTLTNLSSGQCMSRGRRSPGPAWEGGAQYSVVTAPCGGPNQVWTMSGSRLVNGDGWYLQASWSGLKPVTLKPSSYAGMAAQGWAVESAD